MQCLVKLRLQRRRICFSHFLYCTVPVSATSFKLQELHRVISSLEGGLDDLETKLNGCSVPLSSSLVSEVIDSCKHEAPSRRLLRFFLWSHKTLGSSLEDKDFNHAIRVLAELRDHTALQILVSDLGKGGRAMESQTFMTVAEVFVKLGREDEALGIFKNLDKFKCPQDTTVVAAIVNSLCAKGHAKKAEGVFYHHKDKIAGIQSCIYRSLLHGWSVQKKVKEARKIIKEMKSSGISLDLFCYNTFLRCLCEKNLESNPSGLVPDALNVMMEMRSHKISPTSISYNILLSCLGRTRRVKESCRTLELMKETGCAPDWVSYYLVARVLYLTGRFGKGNKMVDEMIEKGLTPDCKCYYDLIGVLCGVERVDFALELFERMKKTLLGGYVPVYDVLIPKLCKGGNFEKGRELWDEAMGLGLTLRCSNDVLYSSVNEVFKPSRKVEEVHPKGLSLAKYPVDYKKGIRLKLKRVKNRKRKHKSSSKVVDT